MSIKKIDSRQPDKVIHFMDGHLYLSVIIKKLHLGGEGTTNNLVNLHKAIKMPNTKNK